jgi:hypothetical protein
MTLNGRQLGFQKELEVVDGWRKVPGWFSTEKGVFVQKQIQEVFARIGRNHGHFHVLDLGSWKGKSACCMASVMPNQDNFWIWAVDYWKGSPGERETNHIQANIWPLSVYWEFTQYTTHLGLLGKRILPLTMPSEMAVDYFRDQQFAFMFIDADHEKAYGDLKRWLPKLRVGGVAIGDDLNWEKVRPDAERFMNEFGDRYGIQYSEHNVNGPVYRMLRTA